MPSTEHEASRGRPSARGCEGIRCLSLGPRGDWVGAPHAPSRGTARDRAAYHGTKPGFAEDHRSPNSAANPPEEALRRRPPDPEKTIYTLMILSESAEIARNWRRILWNPRRCPNSAARNGLKLPPTSQSPDVKPTERGNSGSGPAQPEHRDDSMVPTTWLLPDQNAQAGNTEQEKRCGFRYGRRRTGQRRALAGK